MSIRKFAFPFRFVGGKAATVEQDGIEEIQGCVHTSLLTTQGQRIERPDFGLPDYLLQEITSTPLTPELEEQILEDEPRASMILEEDRTELEDMALTLRVRMQEGSQDG